MIALNVGWSAAVNWIQFNPQLFRSFPPDALYLVGVSGGRDSIALLHWLIEAGYENLIVCHLDHRLRGRSSQADARFVEKLAAKYRVDCELGSANVPTEAKKKRMSIDTAAREARYSFFAKVAKRRRCDTIFLAHPADDLVETFLINLFRGAGLTGLAAMRKVSTRRVNNVDLTIVRPLLSTWRDQIDIYVREHALKFREDASNKNLGPLRNRLRRRIIRYLEKTLGREICPSIWRAATIAAEEENWIDNQARVSSRHEDHLSVKELRALPVALQRRTGWKWLRAEAGCGSGFAAIDGRRTLADSRAHPRQLTLARP